VGVGRGLFILFRLKVGGNRDARNYQPARASPTQNRNVLVRLPDPGGLTLPGTRDLALPERSHVLLYARVPNVKRVGHRHWSSTDESHWSSANESHWSLSTRLVGNGHRRRHMPPPQSPISTRPTSPLVLQDREVAIAHYELQSMLPNQPQEMRRDSCATPRRYAES